MDRVTFSKSNIITFFTLSTKIFINTFLFMLHKKKKHAKYSSNRNNCKLKNINVIPMSLLYVIIMLSILDY